jgi:hypothetical protein
MFDNLVRYIYSDQLRYETCICKKYGQGSTEIKKSYTNYLKILLDRWIGIKFPVLLWMNYAGNDFWHD